MTRVDKPALLSRLLEVGSSYSGQIVSYNKITGHLQDAGNTTTLARYLDLLSHVGLLAGLPKYTKALHRRRASSPKFNVLNSAVMTAASGYSFNEARNDRSFWGRIVESAIGAHLLNTAPPGMRVHYWRDSNAEVDFVLERGPRIVAIEVKSGAEVARSKGMDEFKRRYNPHDSLLVGAGGIALDEFSERACRTVVREPMNKPVERTCTELRLDGEEGAGAESKPLSAYRSTHAYVLLGDAGLRKDHRIRRVQGTGRRGLVHHGKGLLGSRIGTGRIARQDVVHRRTGRSPGRSVGQTVSVRPDPRLADQARQAPVSNLVPRSRLARRK